MTRNVYNEIIDNFKRKVNDDRIIFTTRYLTLYKRWKQIILIFIRNTIIDVENNGSYGTLYLSFAYGQSRHTMAEDNSFEYYYKLISSPAPEISYDRDKDKIHRFEEIFRRLKRAILTERYDMIFKV